MPFASYSISGDLRSNHFRSSSFPNAARNFNYNFRARAIMTFSLKTQLRYNTQCIKQKKNAGKLKEQERGKKRRKNISSQSSSRLEHPKRHPRALGGILQLITVTSDRILNSLSAGNKARDPEKEEEEREEK
ncbi:hypothetical protein HNY73_003383 [Argiope bruennichi]|uniref:Uncharacterized protein n=1 Tax=Argiope bruennichi TaxID=94029 RepID=A0A8T0FQE3_ARGBR|nr:hypothetical protein HNY73_003383 [Argiope bruennichi]